MTRQLSQAAQAAKMIRQNLKAQGLQVRVTSENYSMGCNVNVYVSDLRPDLFKLIDAYCDNFQSGDFDGMTDSYSYRNDKNNLPKAKYVFVSNDLSDALREEIYQHCRDYWSGGDLLPSTYEDARKNNVNFQDSWIDQFVYRQFKDEGSAFWQDKLSKKAA